ncbi:MAG TPA: IS630 family transposase [Bradyrhizobium sp.]|nr:IS630 family transposase [Bradyrhizobium sp.]
MPWVSQTVSEARREFVALANAPAANIRALCRQFNVSPNTAYKLLGRYRSFGEQAFTDLSRRPHHSPRATSATVEEIVLSTRIAHPLWGGRKIAKELRSQGVDHVPAASTITNILARHGLLDVESQLGRLEWLTSQPGESQGRPEFDIPADNPDVQTVLDRVLSPRILERRRAIVMLAHWRGVRPSRLCRALRLSPVTYRRCLQMFAEGGAAALFARRKNPHRKWDNEEVKAALFETLHQPPGNFGINRTTWKIADLSRVLKEKGQPVGEDVIRKITRGSGYRWRKARIVLTSSDPEFSTKVDRIREILGSLGKDEAFFSIDEYGPFAVKDQPGRALTAPCEQRFVQQWQRSRGSITMTAAIELASNQVTHFYSEKKNTAEMLRMMNVLIEQYRDRRRIYLSWDAASWHISKELNRTIEQHNQSGATPAVELAPLPARAQFLNVIESVFSGMARAIIHNSNYRTVDEAKAAIDRYFLERNQHFQANPRRAGKKIWGRERVPAAFSPSHNCKDPRLG